jgi:hypothetical protein
MIKKYIQYIKENFKDIDPFDEEDWDEEYDDGEFKINALALWPMN